MEDSQMKIREAKEESQIKESAKQIRDKKQPRQKIFHTIELSPQSLPRRVMSYPHVNKGIYTKV